MKKVNFSQYVRSTGIIIGFVLVLFGGFGVQKSLASDYLYQLNWDRNDVGNDQSLEWRFATSSLVGTIKSLTYRAENFVGANNKIALYYATTSDYVFLGECNGNNNGISLGDNKYKIDLSNCGVLDNYEFSSLYAYKFQLHLGNGDVADIFGSDLSSSVEILEVGGDGIPYLKLELSGALPVIGLMHPVPNLTYGNPVKFSGGIVNSVDWSIYTGNELDTVDNLQLSGFSANGLNDDFMIDHAFYLSPGVYYLNVVANGLNGVATTSYSFEVDDSVSTWGTSTVPIILQSISDTESLASSTAHGFFDGLGDVMDNSCNFDFFSVFTVTTWKACSIGVFDFMTEWIATNFLNMVDIALSKWPWGYGYRVLKVLASPFVEQTMPDLEFTMPADMGLPASAVGRSFEFNPIESYASAKSTIIASNQDTWDQVLYWWNFFCYLTFAFYLVHKMKTFTL